ncbi:MAG: hypothetical protein ACLPX5_14365 [Dissulfurispiraceae bacterium]
MRTEPVQNARSITGTYTLILYQDKDYFGLLTIAFLAAEGYTFQPYAPEFNYGVTPNMDGGEALKVAQAFIRKNPDYMSTSISKIVDPAGTTLGYEIMPLYRAFNYGTSNVMTISYILKAPGIVQIHLDLLSQVKNDINGM